MNGDERRLEHADAEKLFEQIRDCTKLMGRLASDEHRRLHLENHQSPIGRGQALVLRILSQDDGLPQMMLAEKLDIRPSSLGELVSKLETNGFVERRKNQADKRVYNVFLTDKGREIQENFVNPWRKISTVWAAELSTTEIAQLNELMYKLLLSMQSALQKSEKTAQSSPPHGLDMWLQGRHFPGHPHHFDERHNPYDDEDL